MRIKAVSIYPAEKVMSQNRSKCHLLQSNEQPNSNSACLSLLSLNRSDCYCFFEKVKSVNIVRLLIDLILCLDVYNCSFSMRASFRPSTFVFSSIQCWTQAPLLGHPWSFMSAYKCMCIHTCIQYSGFTSLAAHKFIASTTQPGDRTRVVGVGG